MIKVKLEHNVDLSGIPEENQHGDCFVQALHQFLKNPKRYTLVHGVVTGQGAIEGIEHNHAWVIDEKNEQVIDNTLPGNKRIPIGIYYWVGKISITREYKEKEVMEMIDKYGTYGPWDEVFNDYP